MRQYAALGQWAFPIRVVPTRGVGEPALAGGGGGLAALPHQRGHPGGGGGGGP